MVKSLVSKLSTASNLSLASTFSSSGGSGVQETNYLKHRNDPGRFFGDGVQFKAKLIGILEVGEARGDRMCQEALQDLKMAIRAAGEHKQRITIHVTIEGLRLRDEKTGDSMYHHPVHKISFIAQDMTDSRAFGYIFGSPDSGHRFFGIKTDKAASQVVLAMRDLFQVVFELKKKEIELARQQIQTKTLHDHQSQLASLSSLKSAATGMSATVHGDLSGVANVSHTLSVLGSLGASTSSASARLGVNLDAKGAVAKELSPESVADLVDLEQELNSIQRGISQMERITPNETNVGPTTSQAGKSASEDDPFGDSFTNFPTYNILPPPPESGRTRNKPLKSTESAGASQISGLLSPVPANSSPATLQAGDDEDNWLHELDQQNDVFDTSKTTSMGVISMAALSGGVPIAPLAASENTSTPTQQLSEASAVADVEPCGLGLANLGETPTTGGDPLNAVKSDAFTDLDPLGTGRTRPYVDKKYFFQELKNPPKKVLKDLTGTASSGGLGYSSDSGSQYATMVDDFLSKEDMFDESALGYDSERTQPQNITLTNTPAAGPGSAAAAATGTDPGASAKGTPSDDPVLLPRDTDPFSPTRKKSDPDPFQEGDLFSKLDAFEFEFGGDNKEKPEPVATATAPETVFNGPLQVQLPPESGIPPPPPSQAAPHWKGDISRLERHSNENSSVRSRPTPSASIAAVTHSPAMAQAAVFKQQTVDVISSISNKKMPHLFGQARFSKRDNNSSVNMRRLQESDSLSETETAPEPPPRPDSAPYSEPPPLPPKKQFNDIVIRPHSATIPPPVTSGSRYEYLNNTTTTSGMRSAGGRSSAGANVDVPPIPLPSRRVGRCDGYFPGPVRPRKPGYTEDDYLAPIGSNLAGIGAGADVPPLLPPPTHISSRTRTQRHHSQSKVQDIYENKAEIMQAQSATAAAEAASLAPNITLTQLLTLGIDELALKLNVPTSKLSTMTLVELTAYLSEYLTGEKSKPVAHSKPKSISPVPHASKPTASATKPEPAVFRVNFDHHTSFVAKFDDTFGEDLPEHDSFVANFANFCDVPSATISGSSEPQVPAVPSADRYAVFREIIDQELQQQQQDTDLMGDLTPSPVASDNEDMAINEPLDGLLTSQEPQLQPPPKIDTKITEVVAQAKDRYAALRDIILVENLFEKRAAQAMQEKDLMQDFPEFSDEFNEDQDLNQIMDDRASSAGPDRRGLVDSRGFPAEPSSSALTVGDEDEDEEEEEDAGGESSLDSNDKDAEPCNAQLLHEQYEKLTTSSQHLDAEKPDSIKEHQQQQQQQESFIAKMVDIVVVKHDQQDNKFLTVSGASGAIGGSKDDLEIDELMQRAISNLSLDSRERTSPGCASAGASTVARHIEAIIQPRPSTANTLHAQTHFNDVSTSPIPQQKSPQPQLKSPHAKSPQASPLSAQLSAVSQLIDTATKQIGDASDATAMISKGVKESWATFDSPKAEAVLDQRRHRQGMKPATTSSKATTLHLPPPPPSNTSQQDTAESPCSSDPRDEGWSKGIGSARRGWHKKDRQQTSSSSRDLSPWDDETSESYAKQRRIPPSIAAPQLSGTDRHGYYMRHARRMNSCDEDYDYEEDFSTRREPRKFKHGLSRSRDNFDLETSNWYHHPAHHTWSPQDMDQGVRTRSFERSAYERATYGPPIYDKRGNPLPVSGVGSYERRAAGPAAYDKRGKYYRDYARPNYDYADDYGDANAGQPYRNELGKMVGRRTDYENVYDDGRPPLAYKSRGEYIYECERKSFDRESLESFESATRRRRSFGSGGDVYGSLDSRDEYRERYLGGSNMDLKTRSLRKPGKLRVTGDIDYEQDSEHDFQQQHHHQQQQQQQPQQQHQRGSIRSAMDTRSLQRPSQLGEVGGGVSGPAQTRLRKSSGSSPWDGEEPTLPGQKSWKRPASATETERRIAESRRAAVMAQTPSDGEKDRRFRKKTRTRSGGIVKDVPTSLSSSAGGRYAVPPGSRARDNYDYIACQDDGDVDDEEDYADDGEYEGPPTDEDKFERLNRRRHEMHQRMLESERRQMHGTGFGKIPPPPLSALKSSGPSDGKRYGGGNVRSGVVDYGFVDSYEQTPTPRSNTSSNAMMSSGGGGGVGDVGKFTFDDGFESDFNQCASPPPAPAGTASSCNSTPAATITAGGGAGSSAMTSNSAKSLFRFSNDFSEREKLQQQQQQQQQQQPQQQQLHQIHSHQPQFSDLEATGSVTSVATATPPITQKLRFDDNVKVSQFDDAAFEDDFTKASFDFEKEEVVHWQPSQEQRTNNGANDAVAVSLPSTALSRKQNIRSSKMQQRQELIKKSESVNIFAKKSEDPFEDDEFFKAPCELEVAADSSTLAGASAAINNCNKPNIPGSGTGSNQANNFPSWDDDSNFAKFDENM